MLKEKKLLIGSLASAFLEDPHERISNLETLVKLVDGEQPESVKFSVQRLAAASVLEVLKAGLNILSLKSFEGGVEHCIIYHSLNNAKQRHFYQKILVESSIKM